MNKSLLDTDILSEIGKGIDPNVTRNATVYRNAFGRYTLSVIVPLTSKLAASRFDGTLVIQPDQQNGLTAPSVALVFQMRTLDQRNCLKQMGTLDAASLDQIFDLLDQLTGR